MVIQKNNYQNFDLQLQEFFRAPLREEDMGLSLPRQISLLNLLFQNFEFQR